MIYVLYGTIDYLIKKTINDIFKKNNINDIDISRYNLNEDSIIKIINDCNSLSLFDNKKGIIVSNSYIFTSNKSNCDDTTPLEEYFKNINDNAILVFVVDNNTLDERKKLTKLAHKYGVVKEFNNTDVYELVKDFFGDYKVNNSTIKLLIDRVGTNITLLYNEINKIKIYKNDDKLITDEDIINLTSKALEENNFKLIDAIINKNKNLAIQLYEERLNSREEAIPIIIALATNIRIMYQVKGLYTNGHTENDIVSILKIHPYRVKLAIQNSKNYDQDKLLKLLEQLADLDYKIKSGDANKDICLELFILNI